MTDIVHITPNRFFVVKVPLCLHLYQSKVPFNVVNINLSKKPDWFLANTWGTVSVVRYNSNKDYSFPVRGCS